MDIKTKRFIIKEIHW